MISQKDLNEAIWEVLREIFEERREEILKRAHEKLKEREGKKEDVES